MGCPGMDKLTYVKRTQIGTFADGTPKYKKETVQSWNNNIGGPESVPKITECPKNGK